MISRPDIQETLKSSHKITELPEISDQFTCLPQFNETCYAVIKGTRRCFEISPELNLWISHKKEPEGDIRKEIESEVVRLKALGYWSTEQPDRPVSNHRLGLSLHVVHGCNLACGYCNVQQGTYGDEYTLMSPETALKAIDWFQAQLGEREPTLYFYGGEPFLNWPLIRQAAQYVRERFDPCRFEIVTNATLIDAERAEFLARHDVFTIVSIDGPQPIHDRNRPTRTGQGSYAAACRGLEYLKAAGVRFHLRSTWSPAMGDYNQVKTHLAELAGDPSKVTVGIEFETAGSDGTACYHEVLEDQFQTSRKDPNEISAMVCQYTDQLLRADLSPDHQCDAGHAAFSVTPAGDIYPCQVAVSNRAFRIGNVRGQTRDQAGVAQNPVLGAFLGQTSEACSTCWARFACPGPCRLSHPLPKNWPYCRTVSLQLSQALEIAGHLTPERLERVYPNVTADRKISLDRFMALREMIRNRHTHLKPLSLFPAASNHP